MCKNYAKKIHICNFGSIKNTKSRDLERLLCSMVLQALSADLQRSEILTINC